MILLLALNENYFILNLIDDYLLIILARQSYIYPVDFPPYFDTLLLCFIQQDMWVYISEDEFFTDFNDSKSLFWEMNHLIYGDWVMGENDDGTFQHSGTVEATEVCVLWTFLCSHFHWSFQDFY